MSAERTHGAIQHSQPRLMRVFPILACCMLTGCVSLPEQPPVSSSDTAWVLAGAGLLQRSHAAAIEDLPALLQVSEDMHRFAVEATRSETGIPGKTTALANALQSEKGLHVQYDSSATLSAEQAYRQQRANCLSYTLLFIALAREVGIDAKFAEVDIPPIWDMGDDKTFLLYKHINARVALNGPFFLVVDINRDEYDPNYPQRTIEDRDAEAQFYNNRAVELRLQGELQEALQYQLRAIALAPDAGYLWANLASFYLFAGNARAAGISVSEAVKLDPEGMLGYDTAAHVYQKLGQYRLANYFHERAQHFLDQNPYYHYLLALAALRDDNDQLAYNETRRAIELYPKDAHFFFLMAVLLDHLGESKLANDSVQVAIDLTADTAQQERYRSKFARLTKHG